MANPQIIVEYVAKLDKLNQANGQIASSGSKTGAAFKKALVPAGLALAAAGAYAKKATDAASGLNEQVAASEQVFGRSSKQVQAWAGTLADSAGLSAREGLKGANAIGNMLNAVGTAPAKAAGMSQAMVQLAGDMASFHDQDPSEMLEKLQSGLAGEAEPLRKFGVLISEAAVNQFAYQNGIAKTGSELTEGQKVQARYGLILEKTKKAQGDFARTADSVANRQRTMAANTENASAAFGKALLPVMETLLGILQPVIEWLGKHPGVMQAIIGVAAALAAAIIAVNVAMTLVALNPVGLVVLGVVAALVALVAVAVLVVKNWDRIREAAARVWDAIKNAAEAVIEWLKSNWDLILAILLGPFGVAVILIRRNWGRIKEAVSAGKDAVVRIFNALKTAVGKIVGAIGDVLGKLRDIFAKPAEWARVAVDKVKGAFQGLVDWLRGLPGKIRSAISGAAAALKGPLNAVIGSWNDLRIPGFDVSINMPKPIPDINFGWDGYDLPDIPKLARGGIVTRPTLAMLGEAGPEAVVPLNRAAPVNYSLTINARRVDAAEVAWGFRRLELIRMGR